MKIVIRPDRAGWPALCQRPEPAIEELESTVRDMMAQVRHGGDKALHALTQLLDGVKSEQLAVSTLHPVSIPSDLDLAITMAWRNIEAFHRAQIPQEIAVSTQPGVDCWRRALPLDRVGLYVPGGTAPLFSTLLMLGIPARLAGCREIVVCTPPDVHGALHPVMAEVARRMGIDKVFTIGGAQAIAAMTFGTESIPAVDKLFGPGNSYVTRAKQIAQEFGVAIDMPAGPSELLVIADASCNPAFVAADLISQAEHGPDSQVMLVSDDEDVVRAVVEQIAAQLPSLPRAEIAYKSLESSYGLVLDDLDTAMAFSNLYAPEHLILATRNAEQLADQVRHAGSVFVGNYSCESAGDYASGTNHTLPTNRFARQYSGVSVESFMKYITFQKMTSEGLRRIGPAIATLASAEGLEGHRRAVTVRLKSLTNV